MAKRTYKRGANFRTTIRLDRGTYWCLNYLRIVQSESASSIIRSAIYEALSVLDNNQYHPHKPVVPKGKAAQTTLIHIPTELRVKLEIARINHEMYDWTMIDFIRVGLQRILKRYARRYPELEQITRRFDHKD